MAGPRVSPATGWSRSHAAQSGPVQAPGKVGDETGGYLTDITSLVSVWVWSGGLVAWGIWRFREKRVRPCGTSRAAGDIILIS